MALPTPTKTWQFTRGGFLSTGNSTTDHKTLLLGIKNALIGFAQNPWQVVGSCSNTGSQGMDGVDRWSATSDLNWALYNTGTTLSWIVLKQPAMTAGGLDGGLQLQFDCGYGSPNIGSSGLGIYISSSAGFGSNFSGSTTSPSSATDQQTLCATTFNSTDFQAFTHGSQSTAYGTVWNYTVMMSTDGLCTRFFVWTGTGASAVAERGSDRCVSFFLLDTPTDLEVGTTNPYVGFFASGGMVGFNSLTKFGTACVYGSVTLDLLCNHSSWANTIISGKCKPVGTARSCKWSILSSGPSTSRSVPYTIDGNVNVYDGVLDFVPIDILTTSGTTGYLGRLVDIYSVPTAGANFLPLSGSPTWDVVFPGVVVPCGGTPFRRW